MPLLDYLRASLSDSARPRVDFTDAREVDWDSVRRGQLTPAMFEELRKDQGRQSGPSTISVLIAPARFGPRYDHGTTVGRGALAAPLIIPANLHKNGSLSPSNHGRPWIPRDHLDGVDRRWPAIASLAECDRYLERHSDPWGDWERTIADGERMIEAATGSSLETLEMPDHVRLPGAGLIPGEPPFGPYHIEELVEGLGAVELRGCLAGVTGDERCRGLLDDTQLRESRRGHLANAEGRYPLAERQREALLHVGALAPGEILAVNGPPGTGKTTLICSLVANAVVGAALAAPADDGRRRAPVIVVASTNNRALESIVDTLDSVRLPAALEGTPIARRWVPHAGSLALRLPSKNGRSECERKGQQWAVFGREPKGLPEHMHAPETLGKARSLVLQSAAEHFRKPFTRLDDVAEALLAELARTRNEIVGFVDGAAALAARRAAGGTAEEALVRVLSRRADLQTRHARAMQYHRAANDACLLAYPPFPRSLIAWLPALRRSGWVEAHRRLRDAGLDDPQYNGRTPPRRRALEALERHLDASNRSIGAEIAAADAAIADCRLEADLNRRWPSLIDGIARRFAGGSEALPAAAIRNPAEAEPLLDVSLRVLAFQVAARFWEVEWLIRSEQHQRSDDPLEFLTREGRAGAEETFRHMACLTPCFVSTLHMLPEHLSIRQSEGAPASETHLTKFVDLLIIDEAGQTTPEVGLPALALAHRAVVIGDVHQIEPIWSVSSAADAANLQKSGLDRNVARERGLEASAGSMMRVAQAVTAFGRPGDRGLFLDEHRRCLPPIVAFCNDLVYRGRLLPCTPPPVEKADLPALGWAHIRGRCRRVGGSRANDAEADQIATWLARRRSEIEAIYRSDIGELVGIITPYAAQTSTIRSCLKRRGLPTGIVGTVHSLQGAERKIVVFSPTVTHSAGAGTPFFDRGPNMLNVAASRACHAFLTFGDMSLFDAAGSSRTPSSVLARHLFADPGNEIIDVTARPELIVGSEPDATRRIATLDAHRATLREALQTARERLLVVSPWITRRAVEADGVAALVRTAVGRGVRVAVAYDESRLEKHPGPERKSVVAELERAGAVLLPTRHHSKTLAVDDRWIVEGSFNWLSALRDPTSRYARQDASLRYSGARAADFCADAWASVGGEGAALPPRIASATAEGTSVAVAPR